MKITNKKQTEIYEATADYRKIIEILSKNTNILADALRNSQQKVHELERQIKLEKAMNAFDASLKKKKDDEPKPKPKHTAYVQAGCLNCGYRTSRQAL